MDTEYLDINSEKFDDIVADIKRRTLSNNNMPKLIVGTGLSVVYGIPGMNELADHCGLPVFSSSG